MLHEMLAQAHGALDDARRAGDEEAYPLADAVRRLDDEVRRGELSREDVREVVGRVRRVMGVV